MGFAVATSAGIVWIAAPSRFDSGEVAASWSNVGKSRIARKSVGPNQSITAWTRLDWPRLPPTFPSRSTLTLPIVAVETPPEVADEGGEVAAGRRAPRREAVGVEAVLRGVRAKPADRAAAVVDLRGPDRRAAQAVVEARDGVARGAERGDVAGRRELAAARPSSAVDPDDQRVRRRAAERQVEVEQDVLRLASPAHVGPVDEVRNERVGLGGRGPGSAMHEAMTTTQSEPAHEIHHAGSTAGMREAFTRISA